VGLVACDGRAVPVARGDDSEPHVRDGGDCAGRAPDRHRRGAVQNHESRRAPANCQRTVPRKIRQRNQIHSSADARGTSQSNSR